MQAYMIKLCRLRSRIFYNIQATTMEASNLVNKVGAGLQNLGNTCFFNAVTQVMLHTTSLAEALQAKVHSSHCNKQNWCIACAMEELFQSSKKSKVVMPNNIVHNLKNIFKKFRLGRQEDSHEFLRYLVEGMQEAETGKLGKEREKNEMLVAKSLAYKVFGGRLRTFVQCLSCQHRSLTSERYYDMSIECQRSSSLQEGLNSFFRVDQLTGANKYRCDSCKQLSNARKGSSILTIPHVITFQLKRFTNTLRKIGKMISYPKVLDLHQFMDPDSQHKSQSRLQLYGVTVHAGGSANCGHYYSFVKCNNHWYQMNDSHVREVREDVALNQQAYLLFYRKINDEHHISINNHNIISMEEKELIREIKEDEEKQQQKKKGHQNHQSEDKNKNKIATVTVRKLSIDKERQFAKEHQQVKNGVRQSKSVAAIKNGQGKKQTEQPKTRKKSAELSEKEIEETKRKISMDIEALKEQFKELKNSDAEKLEKNGVQSNGTSNGKSNGKNNGKNNENKDENETILIGGKTIASTIFGSTQAQKPQKLAPEDNDDDDDSLHPPLKLKKKRSKQQALSSMNLMQLLLKYSEELIYLQSKLPRKGSGHRIMRPMYNLRKYEMALKKRKMG